MFVAERSEQAVIELIALIESNFSIEISPERVDAFSFAAENFACENFGSTEGLISAINAQSVVPETWAHILHLATNHETRLFRHPASLEVVANACANKSHPKVISVGCSTGEEAYSIAATLLRDGHPSFHIVGVDVSSQCISTARKGEYKSHPLLTRSVAAQLTNGRSRIHSWIRDMVDFQVHNILGSDPLPVAEPDVVITQNMLIYYRVETRHEILNRLANVLPRGGCLIAGPAEEAGWQNMSMRRTACTSASVYIKD